MTPRLDNPHALFPAGIRAMLALESALHQTGLDPALLELVRLRASQINGCAYGIHMHKMALQVCGTRHEKLHLLGGWQDSNLFTPRERAALGWTEVLTRLGETGVTEADYIDLAFEFSGEEQVQLTLAIGAINLWNRLRVGLRAARRVDAAKDGQAFAA